MFLNFKTKKMTKIQIKTFGGSLLFEHKAEDIQ